MTKGEVITCKAAVAWKPNEPMVIEEIQVDPPKADEVRVRVRSTGICFSDVAALSGKMLDLQWPMILGHEASGVVESVGEGVTDFAPGDHVLSLFLPQCKKCRVCKDETANVCLQFLGAQMKGLMPDGTTRFSCRGEKIYAFCGCSTFSEYTVLNVMNTTKINPKAPLEKVCLLSCGISTGYGAAVKSAGVKEGSTAAIWGLGTLGLAALMGCKNAGAKKIIGIDINPSKFAVAEELGGTDFINPLELTVPIEQYLMEKFGGAIEYTFECIGRTQTMMQAYDSCAVGNGVCVLIGMPEMTAILNIPPINFLLGKTLKGTFFGGYKSVDDTAQLVEEYMNGKIKIDPFITHAIKLEDVNDGFDMLKAGKCIRAIIHF